MHHVCQKTLFFLGAAEQVRSLKEPFGKNQQEPRPRIFHETVNARDLQKKVKECVDMSQLERVVITRRGKPAAVLVGVEGKDWDDVVLQTSSRFWKLIEERRKESTLSMKELQTRLKKRRK